MWQIQVLLGGGSAGLATTGRWQATLLRAGAAGRWALVLLVERLPARQRPAALRGPPAGADSLVLVHRLWRRARRDNSLSGSETGASSGENTARSAFGANASSSSGFGEADGSAFRGGSAVLHGDSDRLANVFFSYSAVTDALAPPSPAGRRPSSAAPPGSPLAGGRPRTAALAARQSLQRPISALGRAWG